MDPKPQNNGDPSPDQNAAALDPLALGSAEAPPQATLVEKVRAAGRSIFAKYGINWKAGPGRPRNDGDPKSSDIPLDAPSTALPVGATASDAPGYPGFDANRVRRIYKAVAKSLSGWADKIVFRKAKEATGDPLYAQELVTQCSVTEPEAAAFGDLAAELGQMFGANEKYMALTAALITVGSVAGRYAVVIQDLNHHLELRRRATQFPANVAAVHKA